MYIKREVKLAITAIAAVIILIWGINFLKARALFDRNNVFYGVYDRVDGLKVSSGVVYRGYSVGQVTKIQFVGERFDKVLVQFTVGKKLEIAENSVAAIESVDLMGSKAINIVPGSSLEYASSGDTLRTEMQLGLMEQLNEQIAPLKKKAENIMITLDTVLIALQDILSGDAEGNIKGSLKSISRTLNNVEHASGSLDALLTKESGRISDILEHVNSITGNLENNNERISRSLDNVAVISDSLRAVNLNNTIHRLNGILAEVDTIARKVNRGKGTAGGLVNDNNLYYNLTEVSDNLNKLLVEFRGNPKKFVNLSVFDFTSNKREPDNYGIVISDSDEPIHMNSRLYVEHPDLKEIRRDGRFLYLIDTYKNLKQAQKDLKNVNKQYQDAYIVKIDPNR